MRISFIILFLFTTFSYAQPVRNGAKIVQIAQKAITAQNGRKILGAYGSSCLQKLPTTQTQTLNPTNRRFFGTSSDSSSSSSRNPFNTHNSSRVSQATTALSNIIEAWSKGESNQFVRKDFLEMHNIDDVNHNDINWMSPKEIALGITQPTYTNTEDYKNSIDLLKLKNFAKSVRSQYYSNFPSRILLRAKLIPLNLNLFHNIHNTNKIHFNLSGVQLDTLLDLLKNNHSGGPFRTDIIDHVRKLSIKENYNEITEPLIADHLNTIWELHVILSNPDYFNKTKFYFEIPAQNNNKKFTLITRPKQYFKELKDYYNVLNE